MHCFFTTHTNLFFHCLHVDVKISYVIVYPITLTCFIIVYTLTSDNFPRGGYAARRPSRHVLSLFIINVSCYFLHFHFILFCYYLHFDVLLLCKHLTAFLVVVARQKQGGRASDRAAAKLHRSPSLHQRRRGLLCTTSFSDSEEGNRTDYSKLTTSYSKSGDTDLKH